MQKLSSFSSKTKWTQKLDFFIFIQFILNGNQKNIHSVGTLHSPPSCVWGCMLLDITCPQKKEGKYILLYQIQFIILILWFRLHFIIYSTFFIYFL